MRMDFGCEACPRVSDRPWSCRLGSCLLPLGNPNSGAAVLAWEGFLGATGKNKPTLCCIWGRAGCGPFPCAGRGEPDVHRRQPCTHSPSSAFICSCPSRVMRGTCARSLGRSWDVKCGTALLLALRAPGSAGCLCRHSTAGGHGTTGSPYEAGSAHNLAGLPSSTACTSQQVLLPAGRMAALC